MAEGIIAAVDFTIGVPVIVGDLVGFSSFQGFIDIKSMIDNVNVSDQVEFIAKMQLVDGEGLRTYARTLITGANIQALIDQGVVPDQLDYFAPQLVPADYPTQLEITWLAGVPKNIGWAHRDLVAGD